MIVVPACSQTCTLNNACAHVNAFVCAHTSQWCACQYLCTLPFVTLTMKVTVCLTLCVQLQAHVLVAKYKICA